MTDSDPNGGPERPLTRRGMLAAVGGGIGGGLLGATLLPDALDPPPVDRTAGDVDDGASPVDESDLPYAVWQYHYASDGEHDGLAIASPINVVFPLEDAHFDDVIGTLESAGWADPPLDYTLWAWDRAEGRYRRPHWSGAETYFGLSGRVHVRAWHFEGTASLQAHVDSPPVPRHEIRSYAEARAAVESLFADADWQVDSRELALGNDRQPDHDGLASVIRR